MGRAQPDLLTRSGLLFRRAEDHPSIAYAFNYRDNNWSIRDLERPFRHAHFGVTPRLSESTWNAVEDTWDTHARVLDDVVAPFNANLLGVTDDELHDIDVLNETFKDDFVSLDGKDWDWSPETWEDVDIRWDSVDPRLNYQRRPSYVEPIYPSVATPTQPSPEYTLWWRALRLYRSV